MPEKIGVRLGGGLLLEAGDTAVDARRFPGRQGRLAFAYLAAHRRAVPRDELAEAIWPDRLPRSWEHDLSAVVSKLRVVLRSVGMEDALVSRSRSYELVLPERSVDTEEAAQLVAHAEQAQEHDPKSALRDASRAAELARAMVLPGETADWIEGLRTDLRSLLVRALTVSADAHGKTGDFKTAIGHATEAVALEPYRESGYVQLMQLHLASGNRAEAVRTYERCRSLLADELGVDPSPETQAAYIDVIGKSAADAPRMERPAKAHSGVTVMLVDDHPLWRETLRQTLEHAGAAQVVAEASDGRECLDLAKQTNPDLVIMDMELPGMDGVKATSRLVKDLPKVRVLVLSASADRDLVRRAVKAGAHGYLLKTAVGQEVAEAVRRVASGELVWPADVADIVLAELRGTGGRKVSRKRSGS